ncbi:MAG: hypothetical protein SWY16_26865 [Cyanobacteriota bacterium]|nr:hypothetical protein [Cyanobacteriota bacterium]
MQHPAIFLKDRLDALYDGAARSQGSWEASKLLCLGGAIAAGAAGATNPILILFSISSSVAYTWAVVKEGTRSQRFKPFPIFTQSLGDLLSGIGGGSDDLTESPTEEPTESLSAELQYLSPIETTEALLLDFQIQSVARFLCSIDSGEREQAYKQLVKYFHHHYGAIAQHQPSLLFNSDSELQEAFNSALALEGPTLPEADEPGGDRTAATVAENLTDNPMPDRNSGEDARTATNSVAVGSARTLRTSSSSAQNPTHPTSSASQGVAAGHPIHPTSSASPTQSVTSPTPTGILELDLAAHLLGKDLGQDLKSILTMGESGAGKGNLLYGTSEALLRVYPDSQLYGVNPKPAANEFGRWKRYRSVLSVTDEESALSAFAYLEAAETEMICRQQQGTTGNPYVLVLDEFNTLLDLLGSDDRELLMKKVKRIIRQGRSNRVWLWIGAQTGNCEDIGISSPDRTNFIRIAVGFAGNCDALQIAIANSAMFPGLKKNVNPDLIPGLKNKGFGIAAASVCDRIVRLPNYLNAVPEVASAPVPTVAPSSDQIFGEFEDEEPPATQRSAFPCVLRRRGVRPLPTPEEEISDRLKQLRVRKTERRGVAIFKVWKWAQNQKGIVTQRVAWERFRKDRRGKITQAELKWSLTQLKAIDLIEYEE